MNGAAVHEEPLEPERYELLEGPAYHFELARRELFRLLGGGIGVLMAAPGQALGQQETGGQRTAGGRQEDPASAIGDWLHIGEDGAITAYTGKVEAGQDIRTSLAQAIADELFVPAESVRLVMGDTQMCPYDRGTFGSRTTPSMAPRLRQAAAAARELLIGLAAQQWQVQRSGLAAEGGRVTDPASGRSASFGELARGRRLTEQIPADTPTLPPEKWQAAGRSVPKIDGRAFVTGRHLYPSDQKLPGMLHGKVLRPPALGAVLVSLDTREAEKLPGVVVLRDSELVGVAAPDEPLAARAIAAIRAEWKETAEALDTSVFDHFRKSSKSLATGQEQRGGGDGGETGSVEKGLAEAEHTLRQSYTVEYIAHAPLEPRAALAEWRDGSLTIWTGTQRPFGVRSELAQAFRIPEDRVRVLHPDMGSGYGGKHTGEAAMEAARLAKAAGKPVKLVWTRAEEFAWAYFRPAGVIDVTSGIRKDGTLTAWDFHNYNSGPSGMDMRYEAPNRRSEFHPASSPLRQGSYRALAATANHFAIETHIDELAHLAKIDPLELRRKNLKDARMLAVLEAAAKAFGWGLEQSSPERGFGIACGFDKGGYVATCAEVAIDRTKKGVKVVRVVEAFECGAIVNPDHLENQIEGAIVQGLGGALFEAIRFKGGQVLNGSFADYRVPRFSDMPRIEVVLVDRRDLPSAGAGETPIVGIAPAVGNAIHAATGLRLRSLPLAPFGLKL